MTHILLNYSYISLNNGSKNETMRHQALFMLFSGGHIMITLVHITKRFMHYSVYDILEATKQDKIKCGETRNLQIMQTT